MGSLPAEQYESLHALSTLPEERPKLYGWETTNEKGYTINEVPSGTKRPLRAIAVGAGASGINFAKFCQDKLENVELTIFEKNQGPGGTWIENHYPGCACDIPSVTYQYTWEPNNWSKYYSEAPEILEYFKNIVEKYELARYIKLRHRVDNAVWNDEDGYWTVTVSNLADGTTFEQQAEVFVNACGILNNWQWPNVVGREKYQGIMAHTAAYPDGLDLAGKRVAVVGTGSSGIQIITKIQPTVEKLYTWIRTPTWMTSGYAQAHAGAQGGNLEYSTEMRQKFKNDPDWYLKYRKVIEMEMSDFTAVHKNTPAAKASQKASNLSQYAEDDMRRKLAGREDLMDALIPKHFPVGCKRPTPGNGYLEALISDNVQIFTGAQLSELTEQGFLDPDGNEIEVDVIICATGFNTSWVPRFPIVANGHNLQDIYTENALGYLGLAAPHMPNYFTFYGPYGPAGQGSVLPMIEFFSNYVIQMINKIQIENIKSLTPKLQVILDYGEHADVWLKRMVWDAPCRSWMKGGKADGKVLLYCGTRAQYMELISAPRYEDYDITYRHRNRWFWLGNGFSQRDLNGKDITWYMGLVDGVDKQRDYEV